MMNIVMMFLTCRKDLASQGFTLLSFIIHVVLRFALTDALDFCLIGLNIDEKRLKYLGQCRIQIPSRELSP